ncbi:hypothetical protein H2509_04665 [Stappia sp. F7233]|uniref:PLOD1-3-like GT domain-containing protein n=1 Tax=Stappia albiluteola TaxID=2758565 RepID=A0A839AC03_9HYPH|nr:glycosyltransferase domain-containing protein [Stappia albiluteola]MBA5776417.1 hypothetical protein [Stappia albiluteola]
MKFITVDTVGSPKLDRLKRSCDYHSIPLEVIGLGRPYPHHGVKLHYICEYLAGLDPEETVMFVDGYDVVFLAGVEEIERKFKAFGREILFSTEQNCNVNGGLRVRFPTWLKYPKAKGPYRFLNSGSYVGKAGRLLELFSQLRIKPTDSDQTVLNRYLVAHSPDIALDCEQQIFTCTAGRTGLEEQDYRVEDGRLRNVVTDSLPCVLHCPGKNYIGLEKLVSRLPFAGPVYEPAPDELRRYRKSRFMNRITARLLPDNFLFHLILDGLLLAAGIGVLLAIVAAFL